jgi:hypothetical protein
VGPSARSRAEVPLRSAKSMHAHLSMLGSLRTLTNLRLDFSARRSRNADIISSSGSRQSRQTPWLGSRPTAVLADMDGRDWAGFNIV